MSKYNLTNILNEYIGGSRHGTINISYRDLQDAMDKIEAEGDFVVRELSGPSGDGKVNREFEVVFIGAARGDNKQEEAGFTVYDYKFGFDPASEDNFDEVLPFSIGGSNKEAALKIAKYLLGNRVQGYMARDKDILKNFDPKDINDVLFSFESNTDEEGEFKTSMGFNEENVVKDLAKADEVIKMIKMMNPDVRADLLMRIARMGQKKINEGDLVYLSDGDLNFIKSIVARMGYDKDPIDADEFSRLKKILQSTIREMDENRREKNPEGMGQLYVQPAVQKEIKRQLDAYDKGDMDVDDLINGIEEIIFGYVKAPGMNESTGPSDKAETEDDVVNVDKVAGPSAKGKNYGAETSANTAEDDMEDKEIANPRPMYEDLKLSNIAEDVYGMRRMHLDKLAKKLGISVEALKDRIKKMSDAEKDKIEADAFSRSAMAEEADSFVDELQESTQEESVAKYIKDYYRNPKTGESMISDDIVSEYYRTHKDWDQEGRWDGSKEGMEDGMKDFDEFFDANYGYMFDDSRDIDEDLKKHFKRFM